MKTKVIQLDPHDDVLSIQDKLGWGRVGRVLLVWPATRHTGMQSALPQSRLDLALVLHTARSLGLQLGIITYDPETRFNAQVLGIPVFNSTRLAQTARWRSVRRRLRFQHTALPRPLPSPRQPVQQPSHPRWRNLGRAALFSLAILSFLAVALLLIPEAQISLVPAAETQAVVVSVAASPSVSTVTLAGSLPTHLQSVIIEGQSAITTTDTVRVPTTQATGEVRFTNLTDQPIAIPQGTVVCTENRVMCFSVDGDGQVKAGPGATLILSVTAKAPGPAGNVSARIIRSIQGPLSFQLSASNPQSTRRGSDVSLPAPSPNDRIRLYNLLLDELRQTAISQIQAGLPPGDFLINTPVLTRSIEESYKPAEAQPAAHLGLTLRLQFEAQSVTATDLNHLAEIVLNARLPEDYQIVPGTLEVENLDSPRWVDGAARWRIRVSRVIQAHFSGPKVAEVIRGLTLPEATHRLSDRMLAEPPRIALSPAWWPRLPWVTFRIKVGEP